MSNETLKEQARKIITMVRGTKLIADLLTALEAATAPVDPLVMPIDGPKKHFADVCEYCGLPMKTPGDTCNEGAQHHRTCGMKLC